MKDYKQMLADGWVITHKDGTNVTEALQWSDGVWSFRYDKGTVFSCEYVTDEQVDKDHTLAQPKKRVKTWHYIINGYVTHCSYPLEPNIGYTITEQQPDGSWVIVETTLKASV